MTFGKLARVSPVMLLLAGVVLSTASMTNAQEQRLSMLTDPRMVVIPTRTVDEINNDMENARAGKQLADYRRVQAETRLAQVDGTIEGRKVTLGDVDRRKNEAKKAKRETEVMALEIEKKANEQAINLLNKLKDLRKTEVDEAKADAEWAEIDFTALQLETELVRKRTEFDSLNAAGAGDLTLTTSQQVLRELEVRLLKLQQQRAESTQKLASKQKDIISRRMKLHEAQLKLGMPR
ncbi:MAG: hypothetical protein IPH75_07090 [bacterium]|nr:hypothetical protein [bacterium]